jgi:hypothetical protein
MKKLLVLSLLTGSLVGAASAAPITPFSVYAGYYGGSSFHDKNGNSIHLSGGELGIQQSLVSLPLFGQVDLGASAVFGGTFHGSSSANGNLYRIYAQYKTPSGPGPGSPYGIAAFSFYSANGSNFSGQSGLGTEFGVGIPLKAPIPGSPGFAIEARYRGFGAKAADKGFSIGVSASF